MNTEELYIWNYGIDKLPKGLLEFGKSDVCDTYDESKRQKFQNHGQWMWKDNHDEDDHGDRRAGRRSGNPWPYCKTGLFLTGK